MNKNLTFFSVKTIACFFVICLHIGLSGKMGQMINTFARFAVPFFFMISGYYTFYTDKEKTSKKLNKRLKKLIYLTLTSFIFYLVLNIIVNLKNGTFENYLLGIKSYNNILKFLLLNWTTPIIGVGHLWYLFALLYVMFIIKFVNKHDLYKKSYIFSILIIIGIYCWELIDSHYNLGVSQIYYRNGWLMGFAFFMMGHLIKSNEEKFKLSNKKIVLLSMIIMICILVLLYNEPKIIRGDNCLYLCSFLTNIFIFIIAINKNNIDFFSRIGEMDSGNIYIIHYAIIVLINNYFAFDINKKILLILVFVFSCLISVFYRKIIKEKICGTIYKDLKEKNEKNI